MSLRDTLCQALHTTQSWPGALRHRLRRRAQRQRLGQAYDMAREIAPHLAGCQTVLDVGCGSGFIAYHLAALCGVQVRGVDIGPAACAPIPYRSFDGLRLPLEPGSQDAVLFCYVLHHAPDPAGLLREAQRILQPGGVAVIYEDIPATALDQLLCARHDRAWRSRAAPSTFAQVSAWEGLLRSVGFELVAQRGLSRLRDATHPVARRLFVARKGP